MPSASSVPSTSLLPPLPANSARSSRELSYGVIQPKNLSAAIGGSLEIPFSFYHPWTLARNPQVKLSWRRYHFYGEFFYNTSPLFTHEDFRDWLSLNWTENQQSGSLRIQKLRKEDENVYFCRVQLKTQREGIKKWQAIQGTRVSITPGEPAPVQAPLSPVVASTSLPPLLSGPLAVTSGSTPPDAPPCLSPLLLLPFLFPIIVPKLSCVP